MTGGHAGYSLANSGPVGLRRSRSAPSNAAPGRPSSVSSRRSLIGTALLLVGIVARAPVVAWRAARPADAARRARRPALAFFVLPTRVHERYVYPFFAVGDHPRGDLLAVDVAYAVLSVGDVREHVRRPRRRLSPTTRDRATGWGSARPSSRSRPSRWSRSCSRDRVRLGAAPAARAARTTGSRASSSAASASRRWRTARRRTTAGRHDPLAGRRHPPARPTPASAARRSRPRSRPVRAAAVPARPPRSPRCRPGRRVRRSPSSG